MRWFRRAREEDLFESVFRAAFARLAALIQPDSQRFATAAILGGGLAAKEAVKIMFKDEWTSIRDKESAAAVLSEIFAFAMLSRLLAAIDEQTTHTEDDVARARNEWATVLMDTFEDESRERFTWFLNYDRQHRYERRETKQERKAPLLSHSMVLDMGHAVLGGPSPQMPVTGFPYRSLTDYLERGGGDLTDWNPIDLVTMVDLIRIGYEATAGYYREANAAP